MKDMQLGTVQTFNKNLLVEDLYFGNNIEKILINFNLNESIKIIPFFEKIKQKELNNFISVFNNIVIDLRLDDLLGKLHIVILKFLIDKQKKQILIINDIGFTPISIDFLKLNFSNLINKFENKSIIIYSNYD